MLNLARELISSLLAVFITLWLFLIGFTAFAVVFVVYLWVGILDLLKSIFNEYKAKIQK